MKKPNIISVVIPAKNEEKTIARCIESVLEAVKSIESYEVILVDSRSTDRTVDIAQKYPIKILRLKKDWFISPHAGRYTGTINSRSKYVFFLDADMVVHKDWIQKGLDAFDQDEGIAGVTGIIYNVLPDEALNQQHPITRHPLGYVNYLPGPAIFRMDVLQEVNHFNPFFKGYGEKEIGYRIQAKGYKQIRINSPISYHFKKEKDISETIEKSGYFKGVGQFLRRHFNLGNVTDTITKHKRLFTLDLGALIIIIIAAVLLSQSGLHFIVFLFTLLLALFALKFVRGTKIRKVALIGYSMILTSINFMHGFLERKRGPEEYPKDAEIIKE
jgi:glycosyltransferase involved in cell wall biosynthesis